MKMTLKALRILYGLTQKEAGEMVGVSEARWRSYENCKSFPQVPVIEKISEVFGINYDDIIFTSSTLQLDCREKICGK
ncbi:helix-turn-helix transcriptional regulator [Ligilactobacillus ruminis]|uniref:helix-turn-helix transcriptional regulator n=1 Tax=Ligilactobacillus ruminis TaxID=1623 RepID=UPI00206938D6|nr:helix-turn-helix transcriptional regulator [Ligilactobacillus ruminis]DAM47186.1 MAG TPA: Helix-turn-helix XRE-family like protein [Caudoviricetes sp.]DAP81529.1 MAG TPA: Helix-turn-helix XRE-family like protein [Caudoviricetes sp.]